jgi:hypothetical protein
MFAYLVDVILFGLLAAALANSLTTAQTDSNVVPEQFHIALAGSNGMSVTWFTSASTQKSECHYGMSHDLLDLVASGSARSYHPDHGSHHVAVLTGLDASTKYFYSCGDGTVMSQVFNFLSAPSTEKSNKPISMAIFGDMVRSKLIYLVVSTSDTVFCRVMATVRNVQWVS